MAKINLSSPWLTYYHKLQALFNRDPEVTVVLDEDKYEIKLFVDNAAKADALTQLLPEEVVFGNVTLTVTVVPSNKVTPAIALFQQAFKGNPALAYTKTVTGVGDVPFSYVVFDKTVVQFFNDDMSDVDGKCSTLYQDIAKEVFPDRPGVFFCTSEGRSFEF